MAVPALERLRVSEIFPSLQGESSRSGMPTVFVRLTGCPLRCSWCDTAYAFEGGKSMSIDDVLASVHDHGIDTVCVTGGEPLAQKPCLELLRRLCDAAYRVSLETSGALDIAGVDPRVLRVIDVKAPGSGESDKNRWANLAQLKADDELKFVLADADDYRWAKAVIAEHDLGSRCNILFSPVWGALEPRALADWIVRDRLPVRMQLQLHKLLWGEVAGR